MRSCLQNMFDPILELEGFNFPGLHLTRNHIEPSHLAAELGIHGLLPEGKTHFLVVLVGASYDNVAI